MNTTSAAKPIKEILEFLRKNLKGFPADPAVLKQMVVEAGVAESTFFNMRHGTRSPARDSCIALRKVFQKYDARVRDYWFRAQTFDAFLEYYNNTEPPELVSFEVHNLKERKKQIDNGLPGLYVTYRHSFDSDIPNSVAREVLLINSDLSFRMSFWPTFANHEEKPEFFDGNVIPIGESIVFVGLSNGTASLDRARVIFCHADNLHRECRFGIISSTRLHHERSPCAACIFLVRVAAELGDEEIEKFYETCTRIGPFDKIIPADFGNDAATNDFLEIFLDNSPIGAPRKKKKLARLEGEQSSPEQILRLNLGRFNREMPRIIQRVMEDKAIRAPFKPGWSG